MTLKTKKFKSVVSRENFIINQFQMLAKKFDFVYFVSKRQFFIGTCKRVISDSDHFGLDKHHMLDYLLSFVKSNSFDFNKLDDALFFFFSIDETEYSIAVSFSNDLPF